MKYTTITRLMIMPLILTFALSCSAGKSAPIAGDTDLSMADKNHSVIAFDGSTGIGIFGAFTLTVNPDPVNAELAPMRTVSMGESYIASGAAYFTTRPCRDCLRISSLGLDTDENIVIGFSIKHPFPKGDPGQEPSAKNRLDLDLFDVALVLAPIGMSSNAYPLTDAGIYTNVILNPDGFTSELKSVTGDNSVLPYKICYLNENNNRFEMGTDLQGFNVIVPKEGLHSDLYITMWYGVSALYEERLIPEYYIPEFNRKAAWRVVVEPTAWSNNDPATVKIDIYDWNHGAQIASHYPDPYNTNHIRASSDIEQVTVEVPGMTDQIVEATTTDTSTNGWDDPITYNATFANENGISSGEYVGLVKVTDSRVPGITIFGGEPDTLVHTPDATINYWHSLAEFATYQIFTATVVSGIAGLYPGDIGIEDDPRVVFVEQFEENTLDDLFANWDDIRNPQNMSFSNDVPSGSGGQQSWKVHHVGQIDTGGHLYRRLLPGYDKLYMRTYIKFASDCGPIHHFYQGGGYNPATRWPQGGAGERPNGDERFTVEISPYGNYDPWHWDFYTYWMEMHICPDDHYWGNDFINDLTFSADKEKWVCLEFMVEMNDPVSESNGELALWVDGELRYKDGQCISWLGEGFPNGGWIWDSFIPDPAGDPFDGFRWRFDENLKINFIWLLVYITQAEEGQISDVWYDHTVVATDYIGPINPV